jgi:hypothetical protein
VQERTQNASEHACGLKDHKIMWEITHLDSEIKNFVLRPEIKIVPRTLSGISEKHGRTL